MTDSIERSTKKKFPILRWFLIIIAAAILTLVWLSSPDTGPHTTPGLETRGMIQALTMAYTDYISDNGPFPRNVDNQSLSKALSGENPKKTAYIVFKPRQMNSRGELVDGWGTQFHISYLSDSDVTIISAGPDKIFGTPDDITNQ